jgi:hypothetical protein
MRQFTGALLMFTLLSACGPALIEMPRAPAVQTDAGRQCVQRCQALYNDCVTGALSAAAGNQLVFQTASNKREANNACRQNLGGCYGTCPP